MAWTKAQRNRLDFEKALLRQLMPGFRIIENLEEVRVEGTLTPENNRINYGVRLILSTGYPDQQPDACITHPSPLLMIDGCTPLGVGGVGHCFHVRGLWPDGSLSICYTNYWEGSLTCFEAIKRLALWIKAYEEYLCTGQTIAEYIEMLRRRLNGGGQP